jgi:multicomponent Na+:H+ antiporter subunit F
MGFIYQRVDMFVDTSLGYALLNFIGTLAVAKYIERRGAI